MITSDVMRGFNDTLILSLLSKGDSYGYSISRQITDCSDGKYIIKETTLYSALNRLEKNGFIVSYTGGIINGRERVYFKITKTGKKHLSEKKTEFKEVVELINSFIEQE